MAEAPRMDPFANSRFRVEIDGIQQAAFMECSGLGSPMDVIEYRGGSDPPTVRKLPDRVSYPDIVLKWGVTTSKDLYNWHLGVIQGQLQRRAGGRNFVGR